MEIFLYHPVSFSTSVPPISVFCEIPFSYLWKHEMVFSIRFRRIPFQCGMDAYLSRFQSKCDISNNCLSLCYVNTTINHQIYMLTYMAFMLILDRSSYVYIIVSLYICNTFENIRLCDPNLIFFGSPSVFIHFRMFADPDFVFDREFFFEPNSIFVKES
jgi:hypothetical protein